MDLGGNIQISAVVWQTLLNERKMSGLANIQMTGLGTHKSSLSFFLHHKIAEMQNTSQHNVWESRKHLPPHCCYLPEWSSMPFKLNQWLNPGRQVMRPMFTYLFPLLHTSCTFSWLLLSNLSTYIADTGCLLIPIWKVFLAKELQGTYTKLPTAFPSSSAPPLSSADESLTGPVRGGWQGRQVSKHLFLTQGSS